MSLASRAPYEFHISRISRELYDFDLAIFTTSGNAIFPNFHAARLFAQKMNDRRDLINFPERAVRAGQINAMGLIDEILHVIVSEYRKQRNPKVMGEAIKWLESHVGAVELDAAVHRFADEFPPVAVYQGEISLEAYLEGESVQEDGQRMPNRQIVLEELIMLWLANANPAFSPFQELFEDSSLARSTVYTQIIANLHNFFETQPRFGPENQNLIDMLRAPALASPHSLEGQLDFIRTHWGALLSSVLGRYFYRLLSSLDLIHEENKPVFGFGGEAQSYVYEYGGLEGEPERFSPDKEWMPNLVVMAKNSYVWLDQLSKKYKRPINRLDEIPDEELDTLSRWGFTGLWLIGLWERSTASKTIKQLRGNPDAVASAYSLYSYDIAGDLGGEEAYRSLRDRAWRRGIRLASDMVPNHMGIDSRWVLEHPDWFVGLDYSPFPSYTFNGPNLSNDPRVGLFIEDHYFNNTDAAVVFKRVDYWNGNEKYIYHGNDGTSMPWNDTAQLNYLSAEVREAVIQTILHVARKFPVIRFDAAMTLAKKHYQRLWFPEPGTGGDIASRAEFAMTKQKFDEVFPVEFWREVVDRVAQEVPDTLLLAEAFWMMEGYFVRTLGMHRVYNSAFMNMLRDEKNQEYRQAIKNTLEFEPEILKRYVNFMNNPDERTAVDQFGKGGKYFGIAILMSTLPGLPMFGHGQIEGFTEKYGMEFRRAYWDEHQDAGLVDRHEREIFPLLRKRYLFAEVRDFLLYDFFTPDGGVSEDVFAYTNRAGQERGMVVYHNKWADTRGWVRMSSAVTVKSGDERSMVQRTLGQGLELHDDPSYFTIYRDHLSGLEYIRNSQELCQQGMYIELGAYQANVFLNFYEVQDNAFHQYANLAGYLNGRGVPSVQEALREIFLQPIHRPFHELVNAGMFGWLVDNALKGKAPQPEEESAAAGPVESVSGQPSAFDQALDEVEQKVLALLSEVKAFSGGSGDETVLARQVRKETKRAMRLPDFQPLPADSETVQSGPAKLGAAQVEEAAAEKAPAPDEAAIDFLRNGPHNQYKLGSGHAAAWGPLLGWVFTHRIGQVQADSGYQDLSRAWIDEWLLGKILAGTFQDLGLEEGTAWRGVALVKLLISNEGWAKRLTGKPEDAYRVLQSWLKDSEISRFIGVNRHQDILWFNQENFQELLWWLLAEAMVTAPDGQEASAYLENCRHVIQKLLAAEAASGFQVEKLLSAAK